jgi:hypothetical protein
MCDNHRVCVTVISAEIEQDIFIFLIPMCYISTAR